MDRDDARDSEMQALRDRLSRLSQASLRINQSLEFDDCPAGGPGQPRGRSPEASYGVPSTLLDDSDGQLQDFLSLQGLTPEEAQPDSGSYPTAWRLFELPQQSLEEPLRLSRICSAT